MAYQTYITDALVCASYDNNSADRSFLLFAREAGMVHAQARSVREERSKQRFALQICSYIRVTLVRGKSGWKIAGVEPIRNLYAGSETREARAFLRNIILLLRRVVRGETAHTQIFDDVVATLGQAQCAAPEKLEPILALRILHALGYIAPTPALEVFLREKIPYDIVDAQTEAELVPLRALLDNALQESQL